MKTRIIWCSNPAESKALVEFAREQKHTWWDGGEFQDKYVKGGVGYSLTLGCFITSDTKKVLEDFDDRYEIVNYEKEFGKV